VKRISLLVACVALTTGSVVPPDPRWQEAVGEMHVLVIRATWGPAPVGAGDLSGAAAFYNRASYGKLSLEIDVTSWLRAYDAPLCNSEPTPRSVFGRVGELAQEAAARAGYDAGSYGRIAYVLPERVCNIAGLGVGREVFLAQDGGVLDDFAFIHELGHTFGLAHAMGADCTNLLRCALDDTGDVFSPMGSGMLDYSAYEKATLGWIAAPPRVTAPKQYVLAPPTARSKLAQALVFETQEGTWWVEYRATPFRGLVFRFVDVDNHSAPYAKSAILILKPTKKARPWIVKGETYRIPFSFRVTLSKATAKQAVVRIRF